MRRRLYLEIKNAILIILGSTLIALGVRLFLLPAEIATGGTPGLAMIVEFVSGVSTGIAIILINIPLLLLASRHGDLAFLLRSVFCMLLTGVLIETLELFLPLPKINSLLLSTLYGGCIIGLGAGLVLKANA